MSKNIDQIMNLEGLKTAFQSLSEKDQIKFIHYCEKEKGNIKKKVLNKYVNNTDAYVSSIWTVSKHPWDKLGATLIYNYNDGALWFELKIRKESLDVKSELMLEYGVPDCKYHANYLCSSPQRLIINTMETFEYVLGMDYEAINKLSDHLEQKDLVWGSKVMMSDLL